MDVAMVKNENRTAILTRPGLILEVQDGSKFFADPFKKEKKT